MTSTNLGLATMLICGAIGCGGAPSGSGDSGRGGNDGARVDGSLGDGADGAALDAVTPADAPVPIDAGIAFDGSVCAANSFDIHATPPNVLILLDRSCSMRQTPTGGTATATSGTSKWSIAVSALHSLTTMYATQVHWGLIYLPHTGTGGSCTSGAVCDAANPCPEVAPGVATGPMIDATLQTISPFTTCGHVTNLGTPIDQGVVGAGTVSQLHDATRGDFVLLLTDGEETCTTQTQLVADVTTLAGESIRTAVIGFGAAGANGVNPTELNAMAVAGGIPASGATSYYAAGDAASLTAAFTSIIGSTISCSFALTAPPADPSLLHVFVNATTELARDATHATGWDYDAATDSIVLYGAACTDVQTLRDSQLDALEACPGGTIVPPPTMCHHNGQSCTTTADCCNLEALACDTINHVCVGTPG